MVLRIQCANDICVILFSLHSNYTWKYYNSNLIHRKLKLT